MRRIASVLAAAGTLAAIACQDSTNPLAPAAVDEATGPGPTAAATPCPCWDEALMATAFPAVHFYLDDAGLASLTTFDHDATQQIQALVRFAADGSGSCELATFGTAGRVEALAATSDLSPAQCEACAAVLEARAGAAGFAIRPPDGEAID